MKITVFHGTNLSNARIIKEEGFKVKMNKRHWLGNGIYFFEDYSLAKWWTTNPSENFGTIVDQPAIITCKLLLDSSRILNLLLLEDYTQFVEIFEKEFYPMYKKHNVINFEFDEEVLRCTYCDFLKKGYHIDAIIGNFYIPTQPYLPVIHDLEFERLLLTYTEVQYCIFNSKIISDIEIEGCND